MANCFKKYVLTTLKVILVLTIIPASIFGIFWFFNGTIQSGFLQGTLFSTFFLYNTASNYGNALTAALSVRVKNAS